MTKDNLANGLRKKKERNNKKRGFALPFALNCVQSVPGMYVLMATNRHRWSGVRRFYNAT